VLEISPLVQSAPSHLIATFELPRVGLPYVGFKGVNLVPHRFDKSL